MSARRIANVLSTELERQDQYLAELPEKFEYPLFSGRQAVESQRKSGYKDTARAAREIVDNAIEAGAKDVWIVLDRPAESQRQKSQHRQSVVNIAFIDNGPGMRPMMTRYALTWGGGTHFKTPGRIGRFGFGLPNSSINQTRRVEVYSKTETEGAWWRSELDINDDNVPLHGLIAIKAPVKAELPPFVKQYIEKNGVALDSGTVVVWCKPDRLTYKLAAQLKEHILNDFGAAYRYLLDEFVLRVDGTEVIKVDPLFLMPEGRFYKKPEEGGALCTWDKAIAVSYRRDEATGSQHLELLKSKADLAKARKDESVVVGTIRVRMSRFPYGFVLGGKRSKGVEHLIDEHAKERFAIRRPRRGMAFVRGGREIDMINLLPSDKSLGDWPVLQGYAYHWGIEIAFEPSLDEAFGIGNDKQSVRPIEDFWRVLAEYGVDQAARREAEWQAKERKKKEGEAAAYERENADDTLATEAALQATETLGQLPLPKEEQEKAKAKFKEKAEKKAADEQIPIDDAEKALEEEATRRRFKIAFFEAEGGVFLRPDLGNGMQRVAEINKAHPFFKTFYAPLSHLRNTRARNAVDLLLMGIVDAELTSDGPTKRTLQHLREDRLTPFLRLGLEIIEEIQPDFGTDDDDE